VLALEKKPINYKNRKEISYISHTPLTTRDEWKVEVDMVARTTILKT